MNPKHSILLIEDEENKYFKPWNKRVTKFGDFDTAFDLEYEKEMFFASYKCDVEMHKEQIAARAKEVIHKNLATVQQIACTLGEHMAETEVLLRSIAKDYAADETDSASLKIRTNSIERKS